MAVLMNLGTRRAKVGEVVTYCGEAHRVLMVRRQMLTVSPLGNPDSQYAIDYRDVPESVVESDDED